jgi:hypothetical protein
MEFNPIIFKACPYPFYWKVTFSDGISICEYKDNGEVVLFKEVIDKINLGGVAEVIEWYPTYKGLPVFTQRLESWQRPVLFKRHKLRMDGSGQTTLFALGWQATIGGQNYKSIMYIDLPNDTILLDNK